MKTKEEAEMMSHEQNVSTELLRELTLLKLEQLSGEAFPSEAEHLSYLESLTQTHFGIAPNKQFKQNATRRVKIILLQTLFIRIQGYSWSNTFIKLSIDMQTDEALEASSDFYLTQESLESYFCRYLSDKLRTRFAQTLIKMRTYGNTEALNVQTQKYLEALLKVTDVSSTQEFFSSEGLRRFATGSSGFANLDIFIQALYERYIQKREEFSDALTTHFVDTREYIIPIHKLFDVAQAKYLKKSARLRLRYLAFPTIATHNAGILIASALSKGYSLAEISHVLLKAGLTATRQDISNHISYVGKRHFLKLSKEQQESISYSGARTFLVSFLMKHLELPIAEAAEIAKRIYSRQS